MYLKYSRNIKPWPVIKLDVGKVEGLTLTLRGVEADYFLGVPFAEPPINEYRFEVSFGRDHVTSTLYRKQSRSNHGKAPKMPPLLVPIVLQ